MRFAVLVCGLTACVQSHAVTCDDGSTCPSNLACDLAHQSCVAPGQLRSCVGVDDGEACAVDLAGDGICDREVCLRSRCGDGYLRTPEVCEGELGGPTNCTDFGFYDDQPLACTDACTYDTASCTGFCGDGLVSDGFEICEPTIEPTDTCVDYGFGAGVLGCQACGPGFDACKTFGWRIDMAGTGQTGRVDVNGLAADDVYVANGQLVHFDGASWSTVDLTGCTSALLTEVWEPAPGVVFAAGGTTVIRVSNGTCTAWTVGSGVDDLWASSATNAYAAASSTGMWHFDGTSWTLASSTKAAAVWGRAADDVYAGTGIATITHFDGAWSTPVTVPGISVISAIWGTSSQLFVGGADTPAGPAVLAQKGAGWVPLLVAEPLLPGGGTVWDGWTVGSHTVIAATNGSAANLVLEYDGAGWTNLRAPLGGIASVWLAPTGELIAPFSGTRIPVLDGNVRIDQLDIAGTSSQIAAHAADEVYVAANATLKRWDGATWTDEIAGPVDVAVAPLGDVFGVNTASGLFWSNGSWQIDTRVKGSAVSALAADDVWVLDPLVQTIKHWHGAALAVDDLPWTAASSEYMLDVWAASPTSVFAVGENGAIVRWNGSGWMAMASSATTDLERVWGVSSTDVYAGGDGTLVHYDGTSWTPVPIAGSVHDITGTRPDDMFFSTDLGVVHFDGQRLTPVAAGSPAMALAIAGDSLFVTDRLAGFHQLVRVVPW